MPTVPNLESGSVQAEPLPGRPFPRVDTDVQPGALGAGLASGIEAVGAAGSEEEARLKEQNDHLRVIDANTQLEAAKTQMLYGKQNADGTSTGGAFSLHGTQAINMPATIMPEYDKVASGISQTLTPDQQKLFAGHIALGKNELNTALNRYEYEESNRLADETFKNSVQQSISNASVAWRDPAQIMKSRLDIKGAMQIQGDREGWSKDELATQTSKALAEMHFNVVDRMLSDGQPNAALAYFKGIRDTNELTGQQAHQLGATIDAAFREHQADNQNAVASKIRDVQTAAINGLNIPPSSMPSRAEVLAAFPQDGDKRYAAMQSDITMGADIKNFAGMTPAQIAQHVESYRPTGVAGAADQFERYGAVGQAAQRVLAARAQDPRQYQIDNKLGSAPLDFSNTQQVTSELRSRLSSEPQDSARLGGYVPPLTREESARFAQSLTSMPPAQRLITLATLNTGLHDDRGFQEVMRQVLPGSPVTAIVGAQVGNTNPSTTPVWFDHQFAPTPMDQTRILAGEQLINPQGGEKGGETKGGVKGYPMPADGGPNGLREQFSTKAGDLFRGRPQLADAYFAAFKGTYAQLLSEKGDYSGNGNISLRDQAIKIVLGNRAEIGGKSVAVPPGMDPTRFESILTAAVNQKAKDMGAAPGFEKKIDGYQLLETGGLGSGRYQLVNGNAPLTNPDGRGVFTIDLKDQYLASKGARGAPVDVQRATQEASGAAPNPPPVPPADQIGGQVKVQPEPKGEAPHVLKPPPTPDVGRGGKGRPHPSQGPSTQ
jgi:hypothetical protein